MGDKMNWRHSAKMSKIKQEIAAQHGNKHTNVQIPKWMSKQHRKWTSKRDLIESIAKHLEHNRNLNASKPNLLISGNSYPYKFILSTFLIPRGGRRIKALCSGCQRGIKALMDIPKGTVIGTYVGIEYSADEYQAIFAHSNEEALRNVYAFDLTVHLPAKHGTKKKRKEMKMIIDG